MKLRVCPLKVKCRFLGPIVFGFVVQLFADAAFEKLLDTRWKTSLDQLNIQYTTYPKDKLNKDHRRPWLSDRGPMDIISRRTSALLEELPFISGEKKDLTALKTELASLQAEVTSSNQKDEALFKKFCSLNRRIAMSNPLLNFDSLLFINHTTSDDQFHGAHQSFKHIPNPKGSLYLLSDYKGTTPKIKDLLESPKVQNGAYKDETLSNKNPKWSGKSNVFSPTLSYDTKEILFAWSRKAKGETNDHTTRYVPEDKYRIFKMNLDGTNLRMITNHNGGFDDYDPIFLPNGRIVYVSDKHNGGQRCGTSAISGNMYSCKADGSDDYRLSWHETNERCPTIDNRGMIVYTRWDYIDRHAYVAQNSWQCYPDGRDPRSWHGNYVEEFYKFFGQRLISETDIMPIPGTTSKYAAIASGHHSAYHGNLIVFDINIDPTMASQVRFFWPDWKDQGDQHKVTESVRFKAGDGRDFRTPQPLNEDFIIVCEYSEILLIDKFGNEVLIYDTEDLFGKSHNVVEPIPLRKRVNVPDLTAGEPKTFQGERLNGKTPKATIKLHNIYDTDTPFPEGTVIKSLRICQVVGRPNVIKSKSGDLKTTRNVWLGWSDGALIKAVLGTVPVEEDGSAYFEAPIEREIYFQAINDKGQAVQSMLSGTNVRPGEQLTCFGCHEHKWKKSAPSGVETAFKRSPSPITPEVSGTYPLTYYTLVKNPVFDKKCAPCHDKARSDGNQKAINFNYWNEQVKCDNGIGVQGPSVGAIEQYVSYYQAAYAQNYCGTSPLFLGGDGCKSGSGNKNIAQKRSRSIPGGNGALASDLIKYLDVNHTTEAYKLTPEEKKRVYIWLDLNAQEMGTYDYSADAMAKQRAGEVVWPVWDGGSGFNPKNPTGVQQDSTSTFGSNSQHFSMQSKVSPIIGFSGKKIMLQQLPQTGKISVDIISLQGKVIKTFKNSLIGESSQITIPLNQFSPGFYVAVVKSGSNSIIAKKDFVLMSR